MLGRWRAFRGWAAAEWPRVAIGLMVLGSVYQAVCHGEAMVDDAAITFAYSQQLATAGELTHTPSSERVEGFSNPTWTFLNAAAIRLHMDPFFFSRAVGLLALVLTILLVYRTAERLCEGRSKAAPLLAPLLQAMAPCVPFWTVAGLETPFVALLLAWVAHQAIREERDGAAHRSGAILAVLALTRPEGLLYAAPVAGYKLAFLLRERRERPVRPLLLRHGANLALLLVPVAGYEVFRLLYFAAWLPNTYYAKIGPIARLCSDLGGYSRASVYLVGFFTLYRLWPLVGGSPLALAVRGKLREAALVLGLVASHLLFIVFADGDWMGDFRFFAMAMPLWALLLSLVAQGAADLAAKAYGWLRRRAGVEPGGRPALVGRATAAAFGLAFLVGALLPGLVDYTRSGWVSVQLVRRVGRGLEGIARRAGMSHGSIAVPDVGGTALYGSVQVIDTAGLTDPVFARLRDRPDRIRQYFFEEARPDLYLQHSHWRSFFNIPAHAEAEEDYVQIYSSRDLDFAPDRLLLEESPEAARRRADVFIRREHLTGLRGEMDHGADLPLGGGLRLAGWSDPVRIRGDWILPLLVRTDGRRPEGGAPFRVLLREPDGEVREAALPGLEDPPEGLFEPGALLLVRAVADHGRAEAVRLEAVAPLPTPFAAAAGPLAAAPRATEVPATSAATEVPATSAAATSAAVVRPTEVPPTSAATAEVPTAATEVPATEVPATSAAATEVPATSAAAPAEVPATSAAGVPTEVRPTEVPATSAAGPAAGIPTEVPATSAAGVSTEVPATSAAGVPTEVPATPWVAVRTEIAGRRRGGATAARAVLYPRSLIACPAGSGPPPDGPGLGRIQRFRGCRPIHRRAEVSALVRELEGRALALDRVGLPRAATLLLGRAELLRPTSYRVRVISREVARHGYRAALAARRAGRPEAAIALAVDALRADPLLSRARALYLDVATETPVSPDRRGRALAAEARLARRPSPRALAEALAALLAADRPLAAARLVAEPGSPPLVGPRGRGLAAEAFLRVGLCGRALELGAEPEPGRRSEPGCRTAWVLHLAALACGQPSEEPSCPRPLVEAPGADPARLVFGFEGPRPLEGWEVSAPLAREGGTEGLYVSGYVGPGLVRTDRAGRGVWTALSPAFPIREPALSVQVGGGAEEDGVEVALVVDGREVRRGAGRQDPHMRRLTWDVADLVGREARLRIEDRGRGEWGFIAVDHLRAHPAWTFDPARDPP